MNIPKTFIDSLSDNEIVKLLDCYKQDSMEYKLIKRIGNLLDSEENLSEAVTDLELEISQLNSEIESVYSERDELREELEEVHNIYI